jgi:hypothetical protein
LLAPPAAAQSRAREAEARALFEQGRAHAEAERWVEALDAFRRSRAAVERPTTVFNIATTLIRLGRAQEAIATIADLQRIADPRQHATLLADAARICEQAEASLRRVVLRVSPPEATVEIDGQVLSGEGAERRVTLDPGAHAVVVSLDGYVPQRFSLEPGTDTRDVTLSPLDATLHVVPSVQSASVSIDGVGRGVGTLRLALPPGVYTVGITAEGHHPFERPIELLPGAELTVDATLEPIVVELWNDPVFWGIVGGVGGALVLGGVVTAAICMSGDACIDRLPPYGGTSDTVIVPLVAGPF